MSANRPLPKGGGGGGAGGGDGSGNGLGPSGEIVDATLSGVGPSKPRRARHAADVLDNHAVDTTSTTSTARDSSRSSPPPYEYAPRFVPDRHFQRASPPRAHVAEQADRRDRFGHGHGQGSHEQAHTRAHADASASASASASRDDSTSTSTSHSSSSSSSYSTPSTYSPNPSTDPSSISTPIIPSSPVASSSRTWRPTTNVPVHLSRRHRGTDGGSRWLSEDEGIGGSGVIRRRGSAGASDRSRPSGSGSGGGSGGSAGGGGAGGPSFGPDRRKPPLIKHPSDLRMGTPPPPVATAAGPQPPEIRDLLPRSTVGGVTASGMVDRDRDPASVLAIRTDADVAANAIAIAPDLVDKPLPAPPIEGETAQQRWKRESIAKMRALMSCKLCPPGTHRTLHHPLTLPCGHTLSSDHLSIPCPAPLALPPSTPEHELFAAQQRQHAQRLSLWAGVMCPIASCKRYSPYAAAGIVPALTHEAISPTTALHTQFPGERGTGMVMPSGVTYYPPHMPAPPYSPEAPLSEVGSPLLDTAIDKVLGLVLRELGEDETEAGSKSRSKEAESAMAAMLDRHVASHSRGHTGLSDKLDAVQVASTTAPSASASALPPAHSASASTSTSTSASTADTPLSSSSASTTRSPSHKRPRNAMRTSTSDGEGSAGTDDSEAGPSRGHAKIEVEPEPSFKKELMSVLECDVCAQLMYEPVTTPCQHSFCSRCLARSLDHSQRCPVCRQELPSFAFFQEHATNRMLVTILKTAFSGEYADRQAAIERDERDSRLDTPIFVCTLAFPGMPTILHVFEPRYRLMIRRCIESASPRFGMVLPSRGGGGGIGGLMEYGTMLEIQSVQMLPDGRSMVETVGTHRFRLVEKGGLDGYTVGRIERIDDISPEEEAMLEAEAVRGLGGSAGAGAGASLASGHVTMPMAQVPGQSATGRATGAPTTPGSAAAAPGTGTGPAAGPFASGMPNLSMPLTLTPPAPASAPAATSNSTSSGAGAGAFAPLGQDDTPHTTAELMAICRSFIDQLRSGSAPWLLQRLNNTYGSMPTDPSEFSYWMALVMPIDEYEKARLLPIRSARLRLKVIVHWVESLRGSWWFSSGCVVG